MTTLPQYEFIDLPPKYHNIFEKPYLKIQCKNDITPSDRAFAIGEKLLKQLSNIRSEKPNASRSVKVKITEHDMYNDVIIETSADYIHIMMAEEDSLYNFSDYDIMLLALHACDLQQKYISSHTVIPAKDVPYGEFYDQDAVKDITSIFNMPEAVLPQLPDNMPPFDVQTFYEMYIIIAFDPSYTSLFMPKYDIYKLIYHHVLSKTDPAAISHHNKNKNTVQNIFKNIRLYEKHDVSDLFIENLLKMTEANAADYIDAIDTYIVYLPDYPFAPGISPDITLTSHKKKG